MTADLDGDGKPDLVTVYGGSSGTVSALLNLGNGTFAAPLTYAVGAYPSSPKVVDLNGDGKPDVVVSNSGSDNNVSVLLNQGMAPSPPPSTMPQACQPPR